MNSLQLGFSGRVRIAQRPHRPRALRAALACALLAALPAAGFAQTVWTGAAGDWFAAGNWSAGVPGATSDARVSNSGTAQIATGGAVAQSLILGYDLPDFGTLSASGSGNLAVAADLSVGYGGSGDLEVSGGAVVSSYSGEIGYTIDSTSGATGTATIDGAGSAWNNTYELYVGYGTGTLSITNGASVTDYYGYLGYYPEFPGRSSGTANVDGAGSSWTSQSWFHVGDSGTGVLNVTNGGTVTNGEGDLGFNFGSDGTATIDGAGSSWTSFGFFYVGNNGNGTLNVTNGGALNSFGGFAYISWDANSVSTATIDGPGSTWTNGNGFYVGFDGKATLNITNGGFFDNGAFANVGFSPGADGTVVVSGAGSMFSSTGALSIGGNISGPGGTGLLHVDTSGSVGASALNVWNTGAIEVAEGASITASTLTVDGGALRLLSGAASLDGDLVLSSAPTTETSVTGTGAASLAVTGTAALGGTLAIHAGGATPGVPYTLLEADAGLGGSTFANVTLDPPVPGLSADVTYDANHVYLTLVSVSGAALSIDPGSVDFGSVPAGITVGPATFTLSSTGTDPVNISSITPAAAPFAQAGGDCPAPPFDLAPSTSCTLAYTFTPTTTGPHSQTIDVATNVGTHAFSLAGTGIAGIPTQLVLVSGSEQSAAVGTAFASPLVAQVRDDYGNPVPGITVSFTAPGSGASAELSAPSAVTDAGGNASVGATANAETGSYEVAANGGLGAPIAFALTNVAAVADVGVGIVVDREYAQAGQLLNYTVTLHNAGPNTASGASISSTLSPLLDAGTATWICVGPAESGCTASGTGALADSGLTLPSGGSVSYLVSASVSADAGDGLVDTTVHASLSGDPNAANDDASATTTVVLFRDGFEPDGDGASASPQALPDPLSAHARALVSWPAQAAGGVRGVLFAEPEASARGAFRVERFDAGTSSLARLVSPDAAGVERASAWMPVAAGGLVDIAVLDGADDAAQASVSMIAPAGERTLPLASAPSFHRVRASAPVEIRAADP